MMNANVEILLREKQPKNGQVFLLKKRRDF